MESFVLELLKRSTAEEIYHLQEGPGYTTAEGNATTRAFINNLLLTQSKSTRTSTVILASFNIFAALATAVRIIYDCHWAAKRNDTTYQEKKGGLLSTIHPAETFPLILAIGIMIQGFVFVASQATGLGGVFDTGCATTAQFLLPAIFLVPFIQVVFGAECALRSMRSSPFPARGKLDVPILLGLIVLMEIGVWIPTHLNPEMNRCFASLVWFVEHFGKLSLILLSIVGFMSINFAAIIFYRLTTVTSVSQSQRIAASRMVYYLVLTVVLLAFVLPWFVTLTLRRPKLTTSMMASVVLNLSGLMTGLLQLFLRSNAATTTFRPRDMAGWESDPDQPTSLWGSNELLRSGHMLHSVSSPRSPNSIGSRSSLIGTEKFELEGVASPHSFERGIAPQIRSPTKPELAVTSPIRGHAKKPSYSIFPRKTSETRTNLYTAPTAAPPSILSTQKPQNAIESITSQDNVPGIIFSRQDLATDSIYSTKELEPPRPIFDGRGHKRDSSMVSSATVQIGLRLSNMLGPQASKPFPPQVSVAASVYTPFTVPIQRPNSPSLKVQTQNLKSSYLSPSVLESANSPPLTKAERDARMKTLPPVPRVTSSASSVGEVKAEHSVQLSPAVYSPLERLDSKKYDAASKPLPNTTSNLSPSSLSPGKPATRASKLNWI